MTWQIALQNERLAAAATGNIDYYNQLLQLHAQIFKKFGLRACESAYYPGGCDSTPGLKTQGVQAAGSICPQFSPQNPLMIFRVVNPPLEQNIAESSTETPK